MGRHIIAEPSFLWLFIFSVVSPILSRFSRYLFFEKYTKNKPWFTFNKSYKNHHELLRFCSCFLLKYGYIAKGRVFGLWLFSAKWAKIWIIRGATSPTGCVTNFSKSGIHQIRTALMAENHKKQKHICKTGEILR